MVKVLVMEVQEMLRSNVSSICHLAGRGNVEEQGWNGSQGADRRRQEGWNMEGEEETDTSTRWSQVRVGGEPLSYKDETEHIER